MESPKQSRYVNMPVGEILKALSEDASPTSKLHEEVKGALAAAIAKNLTDAIESHQRAATTLSMRLLWLNIILGVFTVVGTILAIIAFIQPAR